MNESFKAYKINHHVYWVGAIDWFSRDFHGYDTPRGSTYNVYLILGDKITLVDTVKGPFKDEMLARIASVVNPEDISYLISNHSEMDHSGCIPETIAAIKPEKVFASVQGAKALSEHFHLDGEIIAMKEGDTLSLGNLTLSFIPTPMLHWPDSMFTYLVEDAILFSQDAFGMHLASGERYADEIPMDILEYEGAKYYANILLPMSPMVTKLLDKVSKLGLKIDIIAPDHGPIWRKDLSKITGLYAKWAEQKPTQKVLIFYDSMWNSTAKMARAISEGIIDSGVKVKVLPIRASHRSEIVTEVLDTGAILMGSPTMNNNMFPTVADTLTYLRGLKPKNKMGAAFGSYGWSGEAVGQINEELTGMKFDLINEGIKIKYVPDDNALAHCFSFGKLVSEELKKKLSG